MDVHFGDSILALIETGKAAETRLPVAVLSTARRRLAVLRAAPDFETLLKWRSFGLPKSAQLPGTHTIRVTSDWNMEISFEIEGRPEAVIVSVHEAIRGRVAG